MHTRNRYIINRSSFNIGEWTDLNVTLLEYLMSDGVHGFHGRDQPVDSFMKEI